MLLSREAMVNVYSDMCSISTLFKKKLNVLSKGVRKRLEEGTAKIPHEKTMYYKLGGSTEISGNWNRMNLEYFVKEIPCDISLSVVIISLINTGADHREKNHSIQVCRILFFRSAFRSAFRWPGIVSITYIPCIFSFAISSIDTKNRQFEYSFVAEKILIVRLNVFFWNLS